MTPRQLAFRLLQKYATSDQYSNLALDHALSGSDLSEADRRLVSALFYGVIESRITLDYQISRLSERPLEKLDLPTLTALRMGLYQLIRLDRIPTHAAIYETVSLVPRKSAPFVNAVLRAYTRTPGVLLPEGESVTPAERLSVACSVLTALAEKFIRVYGEERAEKILNAFGQNPAITLRVNSLKTSREALASMLGGAEPTALSGDGLRLRGSVRQLPGFEEGLFFVQDEASQLCVEALGAIPGDTVMDVCACPGSKSFGCAVRMRNTGRVLSFDLHEKKLSLIESGAQRLGITIITPSVQDAREPIAELVGRADRVLCDVPCSGFGVIAKKPELRYKNPADSAALPAIQSAILENACRYVAPGGVLVYSTCTVFPEENQDNVVRFLERHPEFSLTPFRAGALDCPAGMITLLPDEFPTDGFFIARMEKKGAL